MAEEIVEQETLRDTIEAAFDEHVEAPEGAALLWSEVTDADRLPSLVQKLMSHVYRQKIVVHRD